MKNYKKFKMAAVPRSWRTVTPYDILRTEYYHPLVSLGFIVVALTLVEKHGLNRLKWTRKMCWV